MFEFVPLVLGAAIGTLFARLAVRAYLAAVAGAAAGVLVALVSGELAESWGYGLFDATQGAVAAVLMHVTVRAAFQDGRWRTRS